MPLNIRIKQYYSVHIFHAMARLDVPTFDDDAVQRQLQQSFPANSRSSIAWETVTTALRMLTTVLHLVSQISVLVSVLGGQRDGPLLAILSFSHALFEWATFRRQYINPGGGMLVVCFFIIVVLKHIHFSSLGCNDKKRRLYSDGRHEKGC